MPEMKFYSIYEVEKEEEAAEGETHASARGDISTVCVGIKI
jgi:hypothetical protein